ncbi:hypothetical protein BaRGS_00001020 [Batillaria attramentaria]|uniref:Uncharacterized protein n=1 Tax=Batillaria attramentaria TaxID=370345 RepID=A0ABD0M802_9CAEN
MQTHSKQTDTDGQRDSQRQAALLARHSGMLVHVVAPVSWSSLRLAVSVARAGARGSVVGSAGHKTGTLVYPSCGFMACSSTDALISYTND